MSETLILIDFGASDHCFAERLFFATYNTLNNPYMGLSTGKELTFKITGKGKVEFLTNINDVQRKITFNNVLHISGLRSNLISVSELNSKGLYITFGGDKAHIRTSDRKTVFSIICFGQLYTVDVKKSITSTFIAQNKHQLVTFDIWLRHLGYASTSTIHEIIKDKLVDKLTVHGDPSLKELYEDCIFGKHIAHPYCKNPVCETEVFEQVYIDIWGLSPTLSAGGYNYFMVIMGGFSLYRTIALLMSKSANITLNMFKTFQAEAE